MWWKEGVSEGLMRRASANVDADVQWRGGGRPGLCWCGVASRSFGLPEFQPPLGWQASLTRSELADKPKCPPRAPWEASDLGHLVSSDAVPSPHCSAVSEKKNVTRNQKRNLHLIFPKSLFEAYLLSQQFWDRYHSSFCVTSYSQLVIFFFTRDQRWVTVWLACSVSKVFAHRHLYIERHQPRKETKLTCDSFPPKISLCLCHSFDLKSYLASLRMC